MNRTDRIKISFLRNWNLPGKAFFTRLIPPSKEIKKNFANGIIWLEDENLAIFTLMDNYIEYFLLTNGKYEKDIYKLINLSLKPGFVALDIGANIGIQSIRMSKCVGVNGKVYSFEPLNYLQEKFKKNIKLNNCENITLFPIALSDKEEILKLNINEQNWNQGTFSLDDNSQGDNLQSIVVKVPDRLEEIAELDRIDLIKIDVEGFEFHVLRGLKATLQKYNPRIIFEYDCNYWQKKGQDLMECIAFLKELDYLIYEISIIGCELIVDISTITADNLFCIPNCG